MPLDENASLDDLEAGIVPDEPAEDPADEPAEDPADEPAEDPAEEPAEDPADDHPATRRETRMQKLANERAEALAQVQLAKDQAEFYRRQAEALQQRQAPAAEEVYQDPDEKWRKQIETQMNQSLFSAHDLKDKAEYLLHAAKNPVYAQFEARVEAQLQQVRARGGNADRMGVLKYLIGEEALANAGKRTPAAKQAQQRVTAARSVTPGMKSNVAAPKGERSLEERLGGVTL